MRSKMNLVSKAFVITGLILALGATMSFVIMRHSIAKGNLNIHFENYVGDSLLKLNTINYKNEAGQVYTISKFKYYIGNIHLKKADGSGYTLPQEYFLINEENLSSKEIVLKDVPEGSYTSVNFIVGVDSIHNCSGAQSGALDPVNAMFWAWNTGYVFLKIEGYSDASKSPGHILEFHIGGFKAPANCIRKIGLDLGNKGLNVASGKDASLSIKADVSEAFKSPVAIDFSKISAVTDFHNSTMMADNYADMFSILAVE